MTDSVRVRFAPSPTGNPHIGNVRTAIFAWLFARRHGGAFMIRVEDTDQARRDEGAVEAMLDSLRWVGLDWDEGPDIGGPCAPYVQSERLELYAAAAERLIAAGRAYRCFCSQERIDRARDEQRRRGADTIGYDGRCASRPADESRRLLAEGATAAVRFRMPRDGVSTLGDVVFGKLSFENRLYDDFIALKSDGFPTYHLASVVDDHHMGITHVLRAKEWLSSIPRHVQLYAALGWEMPQFAHLPVILAPDGAKLSKRHGAASVTDYRDMGVLPEALLNCLSLLGWSLDDSAELFTPEELIAAFDLERVSRSDGVFDFDKMLWINGQHIRRVSDARLAEAILTFWTEHPPGFDIAPDADSVAAIAPLVKTRLKTLADAAPLVRFVFTRGVELDAGDLIQRGMDAERTRRALDAAGDALSELEPFDAASIERLLRPLAADLGLRVGQMLGTLRVAATGQRVSPPIFESLEALGRERTLNALRAAASQL